MPLKKKANQSLWIQPYKLICPSINQKLLVRERLFLLLDQSQVNPLTCIYSPAGFGKSTLVVSWLRQRKLTYGWYSLDINDNDPSYFANHLIQALHQASNNGCPQSLALVQQQEYANLHSLLSKAMMEIALATTPFFMILDDIQSITEPIIIQALRHWLKMLPVQIHVILCCQNEPPFALSSFRVKGQLIEVGSTQLAFNEAEAGEFLKQNLDFEVPPKVVQELVEKTSGWPAAMQLISHNAHSPTDLIDASGRLGQGAFEVDSFILNEVVYQQPEKIQSFLLNICVFEQFNAALCDSLVRQSDSETYIYELEQRQLFIYRVQGQERWYRLQDIFRDCLIKKLQAGCKDHWDKLQENLIHTFLNNGLTIEAVQHCLHLKEQKYILMVLDSAGVELYQRGQFATLTKMFHYVSLDATKQNRKLSLLKAWVLLATYREDEVAKLLPDAGGEDYPELWAEHIVAQAQAANNVEEFELAKNLAEQGMKHLKPDSFVSRTVTYSVLGQSALCRGELSNALSLLKEAEKLAFDHGLVQQRLWSMCLISDVYAAWGKITVAMEVQLNAINMAHDNCIEDVPHMEFLYRNRTQLLLEQGDLAQADRLLLKSEQVIEPLGNYGLLNIHVQRGQIALWRGQTESARNLAFQVNYLLQNYEYHTDWLAHANEFLLACQSSGILEFEPNCIWRQKHLVCAPENHFYQHYQRAYAIRHYLAGDKVQAIAQLRRLIVAAERVGLTLQAFKNKLLLALWLNDNEGLRIWAAEMPKFSELKPLQSIWLSTLFCAENLQRDWPDWSVWFSHSALDTGNAALQLDGILDSLNRQHANAHDLVTPKEVQVLLLIGEGLNNDEIGTSMHIAVSTVKSHIRRLYRKLNISKRAQAIEISRHL